MKRMKFFKTIIITIMLIALLLPTNIVANAQSNNGEIKNIIAQSAIVMQMDTGEVIASKNADKQMPVASTIKLLTSLIFAESTSKTAMIPFTEDSLKTTQTALNNFKNIKVGDKISSNDLMKAVLIYSANDAAYVMADSVSRNTKDFVKLMNERVKSLGLKNTYIVNPCGLESDALEPDNKDINISTAYDMAVIAKEAYKNEWIREILSDQYKKTSVDLDGTPIIIETRNKMLGQDGNIGGKTGNESQAGRCFVGYFKRNGRNLVTVALKSEYGVDDTNVFDDTKKIADTGYNAKKQLYKKSGDKITTVNLEYKAFRFFGPKKTIKAPIIATKDIMYYKNDINDKNVRFEYDSNGKSAWKLANDDIELTFSLPDYKENVYGKVDISIFTLIKSNMMFYAGVLLALIVIFIIVVFVLTFIHSRKNINRRNTYRRNMYGKRKNNRYKFKR